MNTSICLAMALGTALLAAGTAPAHAQQPQKLFPEGDMVRGNSPLGRFTSDGDLKKIATS